MFAVDGLAPGEYAATYATSREALSPIGDFTVASGERLRIGIPDKGVMTIVGKADASDGQRRTPPERRPIKAH